MQSFLRQHESDDWGDWTIADQELPTSTDASTDLRADASTDASAGNRSADGSTGSTGANPASDNGADQFCGLPLELEGHDVILRHEGEETVDGVNTDHFFYSYSPVDVDGYTSKEYWIDGDGLFRKVRIVHHIAATDGETAETVEWVKNYSGWGEHNAIVSPLAAEEAPEEPTPAPTPTPAGPAAWLEPNPEDVTLDGSALRAYTVRTSGLETVNIVVNAAYPEGQGESSTGIAAPVQGAVQNTPAVECEGRRSVAFNAAAGDTIYLIGCQAGISYVDLLNREGDHESLRKYAVTVTGGPP